MAIWSAIDTSEGPNATSKTKKLTMAAYLFNYLWGALSDSKLFQTIEFLIKRKFVQSVEAPGSNAAGANEWLVVNNL